MDWLVVNEELVVVSAEVSLTGLPDRRNLITFRAAARLEWDRSVSNLRRHGNCGVDHHVAAVVKAIVACWQRVLAFVVHQYSDRINFDTFAFDDVVESLIQVEDAESAKQIVSTSVSNKGYGYLKFVWTVEHSIDDFMVGAVAAAAAQN